MDETICCLDYIVYDKQDVTMYISNSLMSTLATLISCNAPVHELTTTIMTINKALEIRMVLNF